MLFGCNTKPNDSSPSTDSITSKQEAINRRTTLESNFIFKSNDNNILVSPWLINLDFIYSSLKNNDSAYIVFKGKVQKSENFASETDGFSISQVLVEKIYEIGDKSPEVKEGDSLYVFECIYQTEDDKGNTEIVYAPFYDEWYLSPILLEENEYILMLKLRDFNKETEEQIKEHFGNETDVWYNHASFNLDYKYVDSYGEVDSNEILRLFHLGTISKDTPQYQWHKEALEKYK